MAKDRDQEQKARGCACENPGRFCARATAISRGSRPEKLDSFLGVLAVREQLSVDDPSRSIDERLFSRRRTRHERERNDDRAEPSTRAAPGSRRGERVRPYSGMARRSGGPPLSPCPELFIAWRTAQPEPRAVLASPAAPGAGPGARTAGRGRPCERLRRPSAPPAYWRG